jgi:HD-like signal output (HDOD) protein
LINTPSKEESLKNCIRVILGQSDLPAFSHHMAEVWKAMGDEGATLNLLTNIILKNISLTTRVLRVANSIHYNPRGRPILSVSRAVTLMGWDAIKNLAASVLVFEHFRNQSDKLKEMVLLMMLTANHARQIAIRSGLRGVEEAYLCGLFRNLGELVVACYLPDEYARILEETRRNHREAEACEQTLKFRYEDLGKAMARQWNLPETVASCMDNPDTLLPRSDLERLRIISSFSHALSAAVYQENRLECEGALTALLKRYGPSLPVKQSEIPAILESAVSETADTFRAAHLSLDRASLGKQILAATGAAGKAPGSPEESTPQSDAAADVLTNLVAELGALLDSGEEFELNAGLMMILEAFYRGAGLDRVLFCLVNGDRTYIQARLGVGADVERLIDKFRFPISIRNGPIACALIDKEDIVLDSGKGMRYNRSTFMRVVGAPSFGILPLVVDGLVVGCLYFDSASESFTLDVRTRQAFLELRNFAVRAISGKRRTSH